MSGKTASPRKGPIPIGQLVGEAIAPVTARRGFVTADLVAAWPEIAGPLYAPCTTPDKIAWPRHDNEGEPPAGVLFLKVDGPRAVLVQHDLPQIIERVNAFFGYRAIGHVRIVQGPVAAPSTPKTATGQPTLDPEAEHQLAEELAGIDDDRLRAALERLGRGVRGARRE
jgi:hypothetical protein